MTIKTSIKDGQGSNTEACVKKVGTLKPKEQALCVNISGTSPGQSVTTSDSAAGGQTDVFLTRETTGNFDPDGVTTNAAVNGTVGSPVYFSFTAIPNVDFIITDIIIIGIGNGIKINNWLSQNSPLSDPCILSLKADNDPLVAPDFTRTRDLASYSTLAGFDLFVEAGGDMVKTIRQYKPLLVLREKGKFGTLPGSDDYVRWKIQDAMTQIDEISIQLRGFTVEPDTV
jgi:hypothetical protein